MKKIKFLSFLLPLLSLISCVQQSGQVTLSFVADGLECQNIKDVYNVGETAHLTLQADELLYRYPIQDEIQVYGSNNLRYDEEAHEISVTLSKDTTIYINNTAKYGKKVDLYNVMRKLDEWVFSSPSATLPISNFSVKYSLHTINMESFVQEYLRLILEMIIGEEVETKIPLDGAMDIPYEVELTPDMRPGYEAFLLEAIEQGRLMGRIDFKNSCGYFTNSGAAINLLNADVIRTKELNLFGRLVLYFNQHGFPNALYFQFGDRCAYKNLIFCTDDYIYVEVK